MGVLRVREPALEVGPIQPGQAVVGLARMARYRGTSGQSRTNFWKMVRPAWKAFSASCGRPVPWYNLPRSKWLSAKSA